jgi:hypothetical protein
MHVLPASNITPAGAPNVNGPRDLSIALIAIGTVSLIRLHRSIRGVINEDLDWERMIDYIAAVALVMLIRLYGAVGVPGTRQQGVSSGAFGTIQSNFQRRHACR